MTNINIYSKEQIDAKIPSTTGASSGDVLTFNGSSTEWAPASGGSGMARHTYNNAGELVTDIIAHPHGFLRYEGSNKFKSFELDIQSSTITFYDTEILDGTLTSVIYIYAGHATYSTSSTSDTISINRGMKTIDGTTITSQDNQQQNYAVSRFAYYY